MSKTKEDQKKQAEAKKYLDDHIIVLGPDRNTDDKIAQLIKDKLMKGLV
jgi:hypothetical protein